MCSMWSCVPRSKRHSILALRVEAKRSRRSVWRSDRSQDGKEGCWEGTCDECVGMDSGSGRCGGRSEAAAEVDGWDKCIAEGKVGGG